VGCAGAEPGAADCADADPDVVTDAFPDGTTTTDDLADAYSHCPGDVVSPCRSSLGWRAVRVALARSRCA
jgi:hypothetical protein